jgi:hypothetical protein
LKIRKLAFLTEPFWLLLISSLIVHIVIISQIDWQLGSPKPDDEVIEVDLVKPVIPKPVIKKRPKPIVQTKAKKPATRSLVKKQKTSGKKPITTVSSPVKTKPKIKPSPPAPKPTLSIKSDLKRSNKLQSKRTASDLRPNQLNIKPLIKSDKQKDVLTPLPKIDRPNRKIDQPKKLTDMSSKIKDLDVGDMARTDVKSDMQTGVGKLKDSAQYKIVDSKHNDRPSASGVATGSVGNSNSGELEGEVRQRKVIFKPQPPDLDIDSDVTITLSFTVLPNGQVDKITPVRKGDPRLERLAIGLLRQYRFEPLFESDAVQSGIIHFTIQRNRHDE